MAKLTSVLVTWAIGKPLDMVALGLNVVKLMGLNIATFATPDVLLATITTATTRLQNGYNNRLNGVSAKEEYDNALAGLDLLLHQEAFYVNNVAKGSAAVILLSGYSITKSGRNKKNTTAAPGPVKAKTTGGGVLKVTVEKVADATSYIFVIFIATVSEIIIGSKYVRTSTDSIIVTNANLSETINGLPIGATVTIAALTQNSGGISPAGPSVTKLIN